MNIRLDIYNCLYGLIAITVFILVLVNFILVYIPYGDNSKAKVYCENHGMHYAYSATYCFKDVPLESGGNTQVKIMIPTKK